MKSGQNQVKGEDKTFKKNPVWDSSSVESQIKQNQNVKEPSLF